MLTQAGYEIVNVDVTVGLEHPKLAPHVPAITRRLARSLKLAATQVSVKAKTGEGMGAVGREEAIRADAVALIERIHQI